MWHKNQGWASLSSGMTDSSRGLTNELGSGDKSKSAANNYFSNAEAFSVCAGSEHGDRIRDSSLSTCQKTDEANKPFSNYNASTVSSQGEKVH